MSEGSEESNAVYIKASAILWVFFGGIIGLILLNWTDSMIIIALIPITVLSTVVSLLINMIYVACRGYGNPVYFESRKLSSVNISIIIACAYIIIGGIISLILNGNYSILTDPEMIEIHIPALVIIITLTFTINYISHKIQINFDKKRVRNA